MHHRCRLGSSPSIDSQSMRGKVLTGVISMYWDQGLRVRPNGC